jgi:hypothetical protein
MPDSLPWEIRGYHGYDPTGQQVITPYKGRNNPESQKDANRAHARLPGPGERAHAQLKTWRVLRKLRCCPRRTGRVVKAIHVLQNYEATARLKGLTSFLVRARHIALLSRRVNLAYRSAVRNL